MQLVDIRKSHLSTGCSNLVKNILTRRRLIVCFRLQVIFHKRATNNRALLQKMTTKDKAPYESSPPCT